jgi:taurine dioxygenase
VEVARAFGDLEVHPFIPSNTGIAELVRFEKGAEVGGYENAWHHDVTWRATPSKAAVLHAVSVPTTGGDTLFSDAHAAYDGLDDETKRLIDDMVMVHDFRLAFGHTLEGDDDERAVENPPVEHPVAPVHDVTGKRYLYVNRYFTSHIRGRTRNESIQLIDRLASEFETPEYQCRFRWEPHSVAIWDNRAVQHYASSDYWPDVRIMERASIVGRRPSAVLPEPAQ